jgi:hypothetical protein
MTVFRGGEIKSVQVNLKMYPVSIVRALLYTSTKIPGQILNTGQILVITI